MAFSTNPINGHARSSTRRQCSSNGTHCKRATLSSSAWPTADSVRVGDPSFIGPVLAGVFAWAGLYLRWAVECTHPRAEVNYARRPKRLRMNSISYKLAEGVHGRWPDRQGSIWIGNLIYKEL